MVQDLSYNLCESLVENIDGVAGIDKKTPPTPIIYLTQWKIVGNSEVHGNEIWSCGEYNATDGKYHILVQPLGGSIADIALAEPLRKVNDVADKIEFPSGTEGKALVTRNLGSAHYDTLTARYMDSQTLICQVYDLSGIKSYSPSFPIINLTSSKIQTTLTLTAGRAYDGIALVCNGTSLYVRNANITQTTQDYQSYFDELGAVDFIYELATPITELVDVPQIQEAESYSCVISQGGKAVEWSSFETE